LRVFVLVKEDALLGVVDSNVLHLVDEQLLHYQINHSVRLLVDRISKFVEDLFKRKSSLTRVQRSVLVRRVTFLCRVGSTLGRRSFALLYVVLCLAFLWGYWRRDYTCFCRFEVGTFSTCRLLGYYQMDLLLNCLCQFELFYLDVDLGLNEVELCLALFVHQDDFLLANREQV
jgi:hypothetical protein